MHRPNHLSIPASLFVASFTLAIAPSTGCDGGPLDDLAEQCGLACPAEGILDGNAAISGVASLDSFFGAVVDFRGAANGVEAQLRAEIDAVATSLGLPEGTPVAEIRVALEDYVAAHVDGGLTVRYQRPVCEASLEVAAAAAAECDATVDPGTVAVSCDGKCTIDASVQAECSANGTLTCRGPKASCEGECTGSCSLDVAGRCDGTCNGTCTGTCTVVDANGNCAGSCDGPCQGTCELAAASRCDGVCQGSCEFQAPSCDASFEAKCEASADAGIECKGGCEGQVEPPEVSAECQATVEAKAEANIECRPPSVDFSFQWAAGVDAAAQAEFKAWVGNLEVRFAAILAAGAKAEILASLGAELIASAGGVITDAATELSGEADLKVSIGAACALAELPNVATALQDSVDGVTASFVAVGELTAAVGG